jgi:hypothetical protein
MAALYLAGTQKGVLAGRDENHDGIIDASHSTTPNEAELIAWVDKALPGE